MENEATKLETSCWNYNMCPDNSEWIAENIKGIDQSVQEMLHLIENDGHSLLEKVDDNRSKQHELIARIKKISEQHHLLADYYNNLTVKNDDKSTFYPQHASPFLTPMNKSRMHDVEGQVITSSDSSLSSCGAISDITPNKGSQSSLSSDSDSETYYASPNERLSSFPSRKMVKRERVDMGIEISEMEESKFEILLGQVSEYKTEIEIANEKLLSSEEEIAKLKSELQSNEMAMVKLGSVEAELLRANNRIDLQETEIEKEKKRSLNLQSKIFDLEGQLELEKKKVWEFQEIVKNYTVELSDHDIRIQILNAEIQDDNKKFEAEKDAMEKNQEALRITWQDEIERVMIDKNALVETLNENLDGWKLKFDMLTAEKDGVIAKIHTLYADQIYELTDEFKLRSDELEREVRLQAIMISDLAEEKREAIRQLCFSLDYFRREYEELRNVRKGPSTDLAS